ncbi:regulator of G-protein signaling 12 [Plakobranchus ocellatus]|uniref:Regulator of G-protein signaling 12 n=1 Tax=Plakobranchus ocellatus TaxID=259542 RepID=A0AAV4CGZ4_9GAST|nr:regulator of G-protein signaling 12 [Plakobranchus ocellatus]
MICMKLLRHELMALNGEHETRRQSAHAQILLLHKASLAVGDDPNATNVKLLGACSVNNIACQTNDRGQGPNNSGRVASWAVNFQNLLSDPVGIEIFTEFLQREFSEENIIFWKACEQYRQLKDEQQRKAQAQDIYSRYLSNRASDPVNVDSVARSHTEQFLESPTTIMFDVAQHQIFQLMRQDSYSRFLKSDLYKTRVMDEIAGKPLEPSASRGANVDVEAGQADSAVADKKKGKGKENEDKRRRSILPWRNVRKSMKNSTDADSKKANKKIKEEKEKEQKEQAQNNANNINNLNMSITSGGSTNSITANVGGTTSSSSAGNLKKAPGPGIDLSTMRKEVFHPKDSQELPESQFKFCRIVMPDGSTTVVCAKPGQSTRYVLSKLCEKRSISLASVDVFLLGSDRLLDLNEDISHLGSKEIIIEPRVMFRLDMPSGKSIGVKAKPNRSIRDVFRPIMHKYGYRMENISVRLVTSQEFLDLDVAVSELDKQRAIIVCSNPDVADWVRRGGMPGSDMPPAPPSGIERPQPKASAWRGGSLEEITNKIFEDLMRGKSQLAHGFDELGVLELEKPKAHKNEEGRSLGLFGLLRKESMGARDNHKNKSKGKVTFALPRSESKKKSHAKEGERLFELLSSAQSLRLEEQRGVHIYPGEMPSFLCEDRNQNFNGDQKNEFETLATQQQLFDDVNEISRAGILEKKAWRKAEGFHDTTPANTPTPRQSYGTPRGAKYGAKMMSVTPLLPHSDQSFSREGVIPSPGEAEAFFRMSPMIVDSRLTSLGMSLDGALELRNGDKYPEPEVGRLRQSSATSMSHFDGRHAFQPLYSPSEQRKVKAPVASPEKFSPQKKKQRNSPDNMLDSNGGIPIFSNKKSILSTASPTPLLSGPNNLSSPQWQNSSHVNQHLVNPSSHGHSPPVTLSSSSSSKTPTPSLHNKSPSPHAMSFGPTSRGSSPLHPTYVDGLPQTHSKAMPAFKNRLSDGMLLHKLQQAQRGRDSMIADPQKSHSAQSSRGSLTYSINSAQASKENASRPAHAPSKSMEQMEQHTNLSQRALLSPRFDFNPSARAGSDQQPASPLKDMTQRALLSPRFDQISSRNGTKSSDPPPYQSRTGNGSLGKPSKQIVGPVLSPRYFESSPLRDMNSGLPVHTRHLSTGTLPPSTLPMASHRPQSSPTLQSFSSPPLIGQLQEEETVTFV